MNWLLIALINPIAHAIANHLDKYIISRWFKESPVGVFIIFSSLFAIVVLPVLLIYNPHLITAISISKSLILVVNGVLLAGAIMFYLYALETEEASFVIPFFQLIPIFGLFIGYFILGEKLTSQQLWAVLLIVFGSLLLSLEFQTGHTRIKYRLILLMLGSSFLYALNSVLFKHFTLNHGFSSSLFWNMVGMVVFGIIILIVKQNYRHEFIHLLKTHHYKIISLNVITEILSLAGEVALLFAVLFAPVALVQSIGGLQPLFVFIIGIIITVFFPRFGKESLLYHHLTQKILSIIVILSGLYILEIK